MKCLLGLILLLAPYSSDAKLFKNAYVQFELPAQWDCSLEGTEWVCSSKNKIDAKESIIILTAKEVGPQDSFQAYEAYLKTQKQLAGNNSKPVLSQIKSVKQRKINNHAWVDALHLSSEIPGYYTRYLATIKDRLAILVTLSAHQKYYTKYSNDYFKAVESLRVIATKDLLSQKALAPVKPVGESLGNQIAPPIPNDTGAMAPLPDEEPNSSDTFIIGGIFLILAVIGYMLLKRK
ncbi:MAG: hypothetical protein IPM57_10590 [Oligoflexia bacterium]|nr:hypothetical protein [Oligoflexia bacterium]